MEMAAQHKVEDVGEVVHSQVNSESKALDEVLPLSPVMCKS